MHQRRGSKFTNYHSLPTCRDMDNTTPFFHQLALDDRILKAVAKLGWSHPTLIQAKAIPLALEGKDILARAKTGSGKTAAYALPIIQKLLQAKSVDESPSAQLTAVSALVLVPSKELSQQAARNIKELASSCPRLVKAVDVSSTSASASQRTLLVEKPAIVVGTPSRVLALLQQKALKLRDSLQFLVVDEADLMFSYGYEEDVKSLLSHLPNIYQCFLMSATLSEEVQGLKRLLLHSPVVLKLEESDLPEEDRLTQFHIKCSNEDKYLLIYTLLKLGLVRGKTLLFVNDIHGCYKLKLFLEQFSIKSCVLNSELPQNSRLHVVEDFNRGLYDYIIATDEQPKKEGGASGSRQRKRRFDKEYSIARGIDFQGVENVVNFDFPSSTDAYIHRVGRTARAFEYGTALSFVAPEEEPRLAQVEERLRREGGDGAESASAAMVKPYRFHMSEIEGFRYRVGDALRSVTKAAVREARLKEIRSEILNSQRLKSHFEENPRDLHVLRHDKVLLPARVKPHLKHVPHYLVPKALQAPSLEASAGGDDCFPPAKKPRHSQGKEKSHHYRATRAKQQGRFKKKGREDPLKTFTFSRTK